MVRAALSGAAHCWSPAAAARSPGSSPCLCALASASAHHAPAPPAHAPIVPCIHAGSGLSTRLSRQRRRSSAAQGWTPWWVAERRAVVGQKQGGGGHRSSWQWQPGCGVANSSSVPWPSQGPHPSRGPSLTISLVPQVMTWTLKIGISLFLPMALIGCAIRESRVQAAAALGLGALLTPQPRSKQLLPAPRLPQPLSNLVPLPTREPPRTDLDPPPSVIPVHYAASKSNVALQEEASLNRSELMRLTIAAVPARSSIFWWGLLGAAAGRRGQAGLIFCAMARLACHAGPPWQPWSHGPMLASCQPTAVLATGCTLCW
jgi:hypothetical protein